jgi:hypothetical protein
MIVNLDLTNYRTWAEDSRVQFSQAYAKAMGAKLLSGTRVSRVLADVELALHSPDEDTAEINLADLRIRELTQVVYALQGFGLIAPVQAPAPFLTAFIDSMKAASPDLVEQIRNDGKAA